MPRLAALFQDWRDRRSVRHGLEEWLAQCVYGLALVYEDLNDQDQRRHDPLLGILTGKHHSSAGKSPLNRLELGARDTNPWLLGA